MYAPKTKRLFFDIETTANPENLALAPEPKAPGNLKDPLKVAAAIEEKKRDLIDSAALDPDYGKVLSIGLSYGDGDPISVWVVGETFGPQPEPIPVLDETGEVTQYITPPPHLLSEYELIEIFWLHFADCRGNCVGYNILSFDLPFLMARSMYLGVKIPYLPILAKFRTEPVTDLYAIRYNWAPGKGLKAVCKLLGIPNECDGMDGSQVKDMTIEQLRAYQVSDVLLVMQLYKRMNGIYFSH